MCWEEVSKAGAGWGLQGRAWAWEKIILEEAQPCSLQASVASSVTWNHGCACHAKEL